MNSFQFPAIYFDGRSPRPHAVALDLIGGRISLYGEVPRIYSLQQARLAEPFENTPCVLDFDDGARLEVRDRAALPVLQRVLGYRPSLSERWQQRWRAVLLALVVLVLAIGAAIKWGVPAVADRVVDRLPVSLDLRVGEDGLRRMQGRVLHPSRLSDERIAQVHAVFARVRPADSRLPMFLRVLDMGPRVPPNAFALPNGTIVINDAMVRQIMGEAVVADPLMTAQLAGVLAHEIGHVEGRHGMRAIARFSLLGLGSAALFGDFSTIAASLPAVLVNLNYSRDMERAADDYAIARLHALHLPTAPLADLFEAMERRPVKSGQPDWLPVRSTYLSSHPANAERSARLRQSDR